MDVDDRGGPPGAGVVEQRFGRLAVALISTPSRAAPRSRRSCSRARAGSRRCARPRRGGGRLHVGLAAPISLKPARVTVSGRSTPVDVGRKSAAARAARTCGMRERLAARSAPGRRGCRAALKRLFPLRAPACAASAASISAVSAARFFLRLSRSAKRGSSTRSVAADHAAPAPRTAPACWRRC